MKKILITGTSGFIASFLYKKFKKDGYEVLGLDKRLPSDQAISNYKQVDILNLHALKNVFANYKPDTVVHLAARTDLGEGDTIDDFKDNTDGTKNIIEACNASNTVKKVLFTSTILVLPTRVNPNHDTHFNPESPYGESKMIGEQDIRSRLKAEWVIVRPTSIWGPSEGSHYAMFFNKIYQNRYFNITGYDPKITFGYLGNFYYQISQLLEQSKATGNVYYIGDYEPVNLRKWAQLISNGFNGRKIKSLPFLLLKYLAFIGDILINLFKFKKFPLNSYRLSNLTNDRIYNLEKTKSLAPNLPYSLEKGVDETVTWYKSKNE